MKQRLAYIDDNKSNLDCIGLILEDDFSVDTFIDPFKFLAQYSLALANAILIDIHMPTLSGFSLYEKIIEHEDYNGCPIVFISSDDTDETRIKSFSLGAVDFIDRRMNPKEMITRINSKILFFQKHRTVIELGNLKLNLTLLKAFLHDEELKLTFLEFKLLCHLLKSYPGFTNKDELIEAVWANVHVLDATIYTHTFNINSKLEKWDHEIVIKRDKGMILAPKSVPV